MTGLEDGRIIALHGAWGPSDPPAPPAQPHFFGSGVLVEAGGARTVEYCVLDAFATIALKFRAEWELNWTGRRAHWQPTSQALAGLLMLRMALAGETVVIASREAEEHRLPICAIEDAHRVLAADALYDDPRLRAHAPAAAARMARAHREALETEHTAFLVAARLHEVWSIAEEAQRTPAERRAPAEILPFPGGPDRAADAPEGADGTARLSRLLGRLRPPPRTWNEGPAR